MCNISSFSSLTEEQKQISHVIEEHTVVDKILSANGDRSFSSSRTTWRTNYLWYTPAVY